MVDAHAAVSTAEAGRNRFDSARAGYKSTVYYEAIAGRDERSGLANSLLMRRTIVPRSCMRIPDGSPRPLLTRVGRGGRGSSGSFIVTTGGQRCTWRRARELTAGELAPRVAPRTVSRSPFAVSPRGPGRLAPVRDSAGPGRAVVSEMAPVDGDTGRWLVPGGRNPLAGLRSAQPGWPRFLATPRGTVAQNTRGLPVGSCVSTGLFRPPPGFSRPGAGECPAPKRLGALHVKPEARWRRQPADVAALAWLTRSC